MRVPCQSYVPMRMYERAQTQKEGERENERERDCWSEQVGSVRQAESEEESGLHLARVSRQIRAHVRAASKQ